MIVLNKISRY